MARHVPIAMLGVLHWVGCKGSAGAPQNSSDAAVFDTQDANTSGSDAAYNAPVALVTGQPRPNCLAVDATNVYWTTSDGTVAKAPLSGGSVTVLAQDQRFPFGVAVDATRVFWVNADTPGQVMTVPIAGGKPRVLADNQNRPFKITVDGVFLYWTNSGDGSVMQLPVFGGTPVQLANRQGAVTAIAVGGSGDVRTLYWGAIGQGAIRSRVLESGSDHVTIASDQYALALAVVDATLYWANIRLDDERGRVYKLDVPTGSVVELASSPSPTTAVADRLYVYWADDRAGTIQSVPVAGGVVTVLAEGQAMPWELAIDEENVYWINAADDGAIMKLAKRARR